MRQDQNHRPDQGLAALEHEAHGLAERLPELLVAARRVSHTVAHGIHGRRRPGSGETFWQFRHYEPGDGQARVDWRRSASSDHLYVRETEWEAAHTVWLWADRSPSMAFRSHLADTTKHDRALILVLAIGELLAKGGERVGLLGGSRPRLGHGAMNWLAEEVISTTQAGTPAGSIPPRVAVSRHSECLMFSDFLEPFDAIAERVSAIAGQGVRGHLVQVLDPAEETLAYEGRTEFVGMEGDSRFLADRAEAFREGYVTRLKAHRERLNRFARDRQWSFLVHHTDRPAEECLLALFAMLSGRSGDYRMGAAAGERVIGGEP